jgi:hypothetical protein
MSVNLDSVPWAAANGFQMAIQIVMVKMQRLPGGEEHNFE